MRNLKVIITFLIIVAVLSLSLFAKTSSGQNSNLLQQQHVMVLEYHNFDQTSYGITITPEQLDQQLTYLESKGYTFITPKQFELFMNGHPSPSHKMALITIDDGYKGIYDYAMPILIKHKAPSLLFLIAGQIDKVKPNAMPKLNRNMLNEMKQTGYFYFGGHTFDSHSLYDGKPVFAYKIDEDLDDFDYTIRIAKDVALMQHVLSDFGTEYNHFAWPYGQGSDVARRILLKSGVEYIYGVIDGIAYYGTTNRLDIPRVNAGAEGIAGKDLLNRIIR